QALGRGGAAVLVDVEAVRLNADPDDFRAELPQRRRGDLAGGAVGAIPDHPQPVEADIARQGALGEFDIALLRAVDALGAADILRTGEQLARLPVDQRLDLLFRLVRQLVAVRPEQLDAVVFVRIVRGG